MMSYGGGNSSANDQQRPLAKYISNLDLAKTSNLSNQRANIAVERQFRIRNGTEGIAFPSQNDVSFEYSVAPGGLGGPRDDKNEYHDFQLDRSPDSLDAEEDSIIWRNNNFVKDQVTHFKENKDYFVEQPCIAAGGYGEVYKMHLSPSCEWFESSCPGLVLKKTCVKSDEIYLLNETEDNPYVVKTLLVLKKKERNFTHRIIMEKCGESMEDYLNRLDSYQRHMEVPEAVFFWQQVVEAVLVLHDKGVIHKDIKPANILFGRQMTCVKLADFGLVERLEDEYSGPDFSETGQAFTAPEILERIKYGRPADIYSLGKLFLAMIDLDKDELERKHKKLGGLIKKCLDDDPKKRPTALEIQSSDALKDWSASAGVGMLPSNSVLSTSL